MKIRTLSKSFWILERWVRVEKIRVSFLFTRAQSTKLLWVIDSLLDSGSLNPENRTLTHRHSPKVYTHPSSVHSFLRSQTCLTLSWISCLMNPSPSQLKFWKSWLSPPVWSQSYLSNAIRSRCPRVPGIVLFHGSLRQSFWVEDKKDWLSSWLGLTACEASEENTKLSVDAERLKMARVNGFLIIFKRENLMTVHYKNNTIDKEIWLFMWQWKWIEKVLDKICINIMINPTFREPWILHLINERAGAYFRGKKADVIILKHNMP